MRRQILFATAVLPLLALTLNAAPQMGMMDSMSMDCAMALKDAIVRTDNTAGGITVTVTTAGDPTNLRLHLEKMARMHAKPVTEPMGMMNNIMKIPFTARFSEAPNGARLTLKPQDPARLEEFRAAVRTHAEMMVNGGCRQGREGAAPATNEHLH